MVEVSPSDLLGRVEPHVRHAVLNGYAIPTPAMASQGDMRRLLSACDATQAATRGFKAMRTDELERDLAAAMVDREGDAYRRYEDFAEHIEDRIDELEVELARRGALSWVGR